MTFATAVHSFEALPPRFFFASYLFEKPTPVGINFVGHGKPADRKAIDAEGFDNTLLVAFTEGLVVDHRRSCSMTDRALDDVHD
jgi:hypothetical protein